MANDFLRAAANAIKRHGRSLTYRRVQTSGVDLNTGGVSTTFTDHSVTAYKKQIRATQFNFPSLVGKEVVQFYVLATDLTFAPKIKDKITDGSFTYTIDSFQSHEAMGQTILYRILAIV